MELSLQHILAATRGRVLAGTLDLPVTDVIIDSRTARPGSLFVPLVGTRADGHDYVVAARAAGAASFVKKGHAACEELTAAAVGPVLIEVDEPLAALGDLAAFWRRQFGMKVVAITGSNGKTSTKEMAASIIGQKFHTIKNPGNFNNLIGLPLSLFQLDATVEVAVLELGMSEPGEIARLAEISDPDIGIITNVGPAHLEQLKTLDRIAAAKGELFSCLGTDDLALVNSDDARVAALARNTAASKSYYGMAQGRVHASDIRPSAGGTRFTLHIGEASAEVALGVPGAQFVINALAAAGIADALGIGIEDISSGLTAFRGVSGRMQTLEAGGSTFINDAYNANPVSTKAALAALAGCAAGRRTIAALGDMLELGDSSAAFHAEIGAAAAGLHIDLVLVTGKFSGAVRDGALGAGMASDRLLVCSNIEALAEKLRGLMLQGDIILLKGSRGMKMERILELMKLHPPSGGH